MKNKTDYTILSKFRNKDNVEFLVEELRKRGKSCYNFCVLPAAENGSSLSPEEQMKIHENTKDFYNDKYFQQIFESDLNGLKNADKVIVLLPAGNAVHIEAGIAYGLGKQLILIGEVEKPETLYLIFEERYKAAKEFLKVLDSK